MERDSFVQKYRHQLRQLLLKGGPGVERKIKETQQLLNDRLEYLDRHGLSNKPKRKE